jgi:hypothetical protein
MARFVAQVHRTQCLHGHRAVRSYIGRHNSRQHARDPLHRTTSSKYVRAGRERGGFPSALVRCRTRARPAGSFRVAGTISLSMIDRAVVPRSVGSM